MYTVFVYGTLRTGASNAFRMKGAISLGEAKIFAQLYRVHDEFPGVVLGEPEEMVIGEVFTEVNAPLLHELDVYEGCDEGMPEVERIYRRVETEAVLCSGERVKALVWEYIGEVSTANMIESGDWFSL